ncbi:glycosyltransferase family 2 protein [Cnuibacter sp. UC19_7]|uniref:glycosyltransferase family 2 protein n=1 Tax=Cnuibacter sp. UC19_7 TaxID=3350166 RepID=UPI00366F9D07
MSDPVFSLVIPCYNEGEGLHELVEHCRFVAERGSGEVILVDNGSTDASAEILTSLVGEPDGPAGPGIVRWTRVRENRGYGYGITSGLAVSTAELVGWTHADLQTDPADVLRAVRVRGGDRRVLVKGRRYGRPLGDRVFTAGMSLFESLLMRKPLRDINAQPTLFDRQLMDEWGTPPDDFSLDLFAYFQAKRRGFTIRRFPVLFVPRQWGQSSWNTDLAAKRKFIRRTVDYSLQLRRNV